MPLRRFSRPSPLLVPVAPITGTIPDAFDQRLTALARTAKAGDTAARDALHGAYAPRLDTVTRALFRARLRHRFDPAIALEDLQQESYLVFAELLSRWDGERGFSGYLLGSFHWRMRQVYARLSAGAPPRRADMATLDLLADDSHEAEIARAHLRAITAPLPERQRQVVLLRVESGYRERQVAELLGIGRRTVAREWDRAVRLLRDALRSA